MRGDVAPRIAALPVTTLTAEEIDGLRWMREEEKLAHDVYVALGETWGIRVFENIAAAETTHGEAIKTLLDRHGIADPAAGQPVGAFTDPELQALYGDLVARGRTSLVDALTVGALIEELDISDLRDRATDYAGHRPGLRGPGARLREPPAGVRPEPGTPGRHIHADLHLGGRVRVDPRLVERPGSDRLTPSPASP